MQEQDRHVAEYPDIKDEEMNRVHNECIQADIHNPLASLFDEQDEYPRRDY